MPRSLPLRLALLAGSVVFHLAASAAPAAGDAGPPPYECRWKEGTITLDGRADEPAWRAAEVIDRFTLPWLGEQERPARTATRARLLWDREFLYFHAEMDDADLYASLTEHDGRLWENDVFELFFKPSAKHAGYYEFQVNPAGAVLDMFIPRRGSGEYQRYHADGPFHVETKVELRGTLNKWSDRDEGWSVEGRIPWGDFLRTGGRPEPEEVWTFALCRYDYSVEFEGPELSTHAPLKSKNRPDFHLWEEYAPLRFVGPRADAALPPFGIPELAAVDTSPLRGTPEPPPPYRTERVYPQLKLKNPIYAEVEPGSGRILFFDQQAAYAKSRVCRTEDDPSTGEFEVLLNLEETAFSLAFHPRFAENGYLYLGTNGPNDAPSPEKRSRVTRYTMERKPPHRLLADSALPILDWPSDGHNGAALTFGRDGMLYITSGDGTSDSDTNLMGQGLNHLLAKVLRIDVDRPSDERPYSVPQDNPFVGERGVRPETWAYGLRNPWRITTDPATGDIWVGNNGQDLWEQVYLLARGANYGWSVFEGSHPFYPNRELGPHPVSKPAAEHHHSEARSLTGGVVYHGKQLPELRGMYLYGDYSTGKIWGVRHEKGSVTPPRELADTTLRISGFLLDRHGELLILDHSSPDGGFHRLVPREASPADPHAEFPRTLSASGLFASVAEHRPRPGVIPYSVNSPLWSDGAHKERFFALPSEEATIGFHPTRSWNFPDGTVLIKSFALETREGDPTSRRWVETRFLTRRQGEWFGYSYAWNEEQTDARLVDSAGAERRYTIHSAEGLREQSWRFPSRAECMVCHSRAANFVLGLTTPQLNREHAYGGVVDNQLRALEFLGLFRHDPRGDAAARYREHLIAGGRSAEEAETAFQQVSATRAQRTSPSSSSLLAREPAAYQQLADPYDPALPVAARARSYLHVNCASCHVEAGGGNAQIDLAHGVALEKMRLLEVEPLHGSQGIPGGRLIAPGAPDRSVLLRRMALRGPGQMPPLATAHADSRAVELLRAWITELEAPASEVAP